MSILAQFFLRLLWGFCGEGGLVFGDGDDGLGDVFDVAGIDSCHADSSVSGEVDVMFLA